MRFLTRPTLKRSHDVRVKHFLIPYADLITMFPASNLLERQERD